MGTDQRTLEMASNEMEDRMVDRIGHLFGRERATDGSSKANGKGRAKTTTVARAE